MSMSVASELRDQLQSFDEHLQTLGRSRLDHTDLHPLVQVNIVPHLPRMFNCVPHWSPATIGNITSIWKRINAVDSFAWVHWRWRWWSIGREVLLLDLHGRNESPSHADRPSCPRLARADRSVEQFDWRIRQWRRSRWERKGLTPDCESLFPFSFFQIASNRHLQ